jgi:sarcosine oxidase subunit gamma
MGEPAARRGDSRAPTQLNVRADSAGAERLGLPREPNTTAPVPGGTALWLGPDEWLVVGGAPPAGDDGARAAAAIERSLRALAGDAFVTFVDVSSNRVVLDLAGPCALEVLMKGCALDLHPRAFGPGRCAQTALAGAQVILEHSSAGAWHIYVRRSFAPYLAAWLADALAESERARAIVPSDFSRGTQPSGSHARGPGPRDAISPPA